VVLKFDPKPAKDSHGNVGPIHTLKYEDGEFDEVFDDATKCQIAMPRASMQMERTESDLSTADTHASVGQGRARAVGAGASGGSAGGGSRAKNGDTPRRRDSASKRVKTEVFSHRVQTPAAYDYAPQHALPLPQTESDGMGFLGSFNSGGGGGVAEEDDACWRTTGSQYIGQPVAIELNDKVFAGTVRDVCVCVCIACACVCVCVCVCVCARERERERERHRYQYR
jgi:hypothetical protein